jgi:DNA modification methylase
MTPYYERNGITIYHGRCEDVLPTLPSASVDLVLTDPPYGIGKAAWDSSVPTWCLPGLNRVLKDGGSFYWFGLPPAIYEVYRQSGLRFMRELYWWFDTGYPAPANYRLATETILFLAKGDSPAYFCDAHIREDYRAVAGGGRTHNPRGKSPGNVIYMPRPAPGHSSETEHISAKPVALMIRLMMASCPPGGLTLDPFLGGGTTIYAAKNLGRRCIGIEIEERYCEIAARRLQQDVLPLFDVAEVPA